LILHPGSVRIKTMDTAIIGLIANEVALPKDAVAVAVGLLEKGATAPFIARYRKEATSGLPEHQVQAIQEQVIFYRELEERRASLLKLLKDRDKLTDELRRKVETSYNMFELDGIFHLFKARRKTRAAEAIEKGLESLAEYIWNQDPDAWSLEEHADVFIDPDKHVTSREEALQGAADIIAEWIAENWVYRETLRKMLWKEGFVISTVVPAKMGQKTKYNMYYDHRESVATIPSHRVLAIRRGSKEGVLTSSIQGDSSKSLAFLLDSVIRDGGAACSSVIEVATRDSYSRIMRPMIETEVRAQLKARADREAIRVFRENLRNLLLSPPAGPMVVIGLDSGKGDERKLAVVNESGEYLESATIRFKPAKVVKDQKPIQNEGQDTTGQEESADRTEAAREDLPASEASPKSEVASPAIPVPDSTAASEPDPIPAPESSQEGEAPLAAPTPESAEMVEVTPEVDEAEAVSPRSVTPTPPPAEAKEESPAVEVAEESSDDSTVRPQESGSPGEEKEVAPETSPEAPAEKSIADTIEEAQPIESAVPDAEVKPRQESEEIGERTAAADESLIPEKSIATLSTASVEESSFIQAEDPTGDSTAATEAVEAEDPTAGDSTAATEAVEAEDPTARDSTAATEAVEANPSIAPADDDTSSEPEPPERREPRAEDIEAARVLMRELIAKHGVRAIAVGSGTGSRALEVVIRQLLADEKIEDILVASVNDAGIAIYSSSRISREEFPNLPAGTRAAISIARRLQDPLSELVKVDPKLIGVGQYQHDVDQKELHRQLVQTVQSCVNCVGLDPNRAGFSSLRHVSGINDRLARRIINHRDKKGPFATLEDLRAIPGMTDVIYEQAAGFLRISNGTNPLDRTAIHPESYQVVEKLADSLGTSTADLIGKKEAVSSLKIEDFVTDAVGLQTLVDIQTELSRPGRDPRKTYKAPKFRSDVKEITDLNEGMALDGTVTNVTNFGAFVDIGIQQDGLVHLSQMSNRFIRDPREAVKVGDVVQVKIISVDVGTKRIGLSIKALLPSLPRRRNRQRRGGEKTASPRSSSGRPANKASKKQPQNTRNASANRDAGRRPRPRRRNTPSTVKPDTVSPEKNEPDLPEASLQEKIAILQSKFKGIS